MANHDTYLHRSRDILFATEDVYFQGIDILAEKWKMCIRIRWNYIEKNNVRFNFVSLYLVFVNFIPNMIVNFIYMKKLVSGRVPFWIIITGLV